jgi:hypothetical protein
MPTILYSGPYRFFFYSLDCQEPPHVHVERDENVAKIWLTPMRIESTGGFKRSEINRILRLTEEKTEALLRGWHEHCSG